MRRFGWLFGFVGAVVIGCAAGNTGLDLGKKTETHTDQKAAADHGSTVDITAGDRGDELESDQGGVATGGGRITNISVQSAGPWAALVCAAGWILSGRRGRRARKVAHRLTDAVEDYGSADLARHIKKFGCRAGTGDDTEQWDSTQRHLHDLVQRRFHPKRVVRSLARRVIGRIGTGVVAFLTAGFR